MASTQTAPILSLLSCVAVMYIYRLPCPAWLPISLLPMVLWSYGPIVLWSYGPIALLPYCPTAIWSYGPIPCLNDRLSPVNPIPYGHCPALPCMYLPCPSWTVLDAPKAGILAQNGHFVNY